MNREIKFRAWDTTGEEGKMIPWEELQKFPVEAVFLTPNREVILMQYIGKKDNGGTEIYDGDYLEGYGHVFFNDVLASFDFQWPGGDCEPIANLSDALIKVIGNIYQNPDLLATEGEKA